MVQKYRRRLNKSCFLLLLVFGILVSCSFESRFGVIANNSQAASVSNRTKSSVILVVDNWWQVAPAFGGASGTREGVLSRQGGPQRTIVVDSYTTTTQLYFYATAVASTGTVFPVTQVTFAPDATNKAGSIQIPLGIGSWDVDVYVCLTAGLQNLNAVMNDAVLKGSAHVDTINTSTVFFTLSPKGLTRSGSVSLVLNPAMELKSLVGYAAKAGIYDITTGTVVMDSSRTTTEKPLLTFPAQETGYAVASIAPGSYLFKLTLTSQSGVSYTWSDIITILPGKAVNPRIEIPNFIGTTPSAPTNLSAAIVTGSENASDNSYKVRLEWRDVSNNESCFEMQIAELVQTTIINAHPDTDNTWTSLMTGGTSATSYKLDFYGSAIRESGSLGAGNETAVLRLRLGSRYVIRLRAVNAKGSSDWVYPTLGGNGAGTTAITSSTLNRFAVMYDLAGGTYTPAGGAPTKENQLSYLCQGSNALLAPVANAGNNSLIRDNGRWSGWEWENGTAYPNGTIPVAYTDYKNLRLVAQYAVQPVDFGFTAITHNAVEMQMNWIMVGGNAINNNAITVSKAASSTLDIVVQIPNTPYPFNEAGFSYESMKVDLKTNRGITVYSSTSPGRVMAGTSQSFVISNMADRTTGTYQCTVKARYTTNIIVSQQFILTIVN